MHLHHVSRSIPTSHSDKTVAFGRRLFARRDRVRWPP